ncbi:HAD family hydrolase [Parabacteroides provencensis]|uniref:HAD family hydrolase n=1 Tax=Parabacteroides provencensis TaxID=1944636 RepID=UPI000C155732|nr:HAD family hydrolase [Parabacteroides provencensis]
MARHKKATVALIYDFDGTLSPGNMQEYGFIQAAGLDAKTFWEKNNKMKESQDASEILCYMKLMIVEASHKGLQLTKNSLKEYGKAVELFRGVKEWFELINAYGKSKEVIIEHYINSSGLKEIIEGTQIAKEFKHIYACSFFYSPEGKAEWPAVAVDFTAKTQFLFMINKGIRYVKDNKKVNEFKPDIERPIPFRHMIYFGDGETDVPCMKLIKQQGGRSIAVYNPSKRAKKAAAEKLIAENRVNFVCPADYSKDSEIYKVVTTIIDKIKSDYEFKKLLIAHEKKGK